MMSPIGCENNPNLFRPVTEKAREKAQEVLDIALESLFNGASCVSIIIDDWKCAGTRSPSDGYRIHLNNK